MRGLPVVSLVLLGLLLASASTASAAGSACDQSKVLLPRQDGATIVGLPSGPQGSTWASSGASARAVAWAPDGTKVYLGAAATLAEVDAASGTTLRTLALPGTASSIVVSGDGRTAYVNAPAAAGVQVIDLASFAIATTIALDDGVRLQTPNHLALSPNGTRLYVTANWGGTSWGLFAVDTATNQVVLHRSSGTSPTGIAVTSDGLRVLTTRTSFSARLDVWAADTLTSVAQVDIDRPAAGVDGLGGLAVGGDAALAYVADTSAQDVAVVDVAAGQILRRLSGFQSVQQVAVNWAGTQLVVAGFDGSYTQVAWDTADPATGTIVGSGTTTGAVGPFVSFRIALCPRLIPDPAPAAADGATSTAGTATSAGSATGTAAESVTRRGRAALRAPSGCVDSGTVTARVTVRNAASVAFYRDGRLVRRVATGTAARRSYVLHTTIRPDDFLRHRLQVRVRYGSGVTPGPTLLSRRFGQCRALPVAG